ncbi:MAG: PD-(D/E)XK nuclease family transposase [Prevotella sp.]|nr:PD-(D/E)XK nuclease family transposase [Prevotella sp.]
MTHASVWFPYPLIICNIFILFIAISIKITIFASYKEAEECENQVERWIYLLKNMETLNRLPWAAQSAVFKKLESIADVSAMTRAERLQYDEALKKYRDTFSVFEGVRMEGRMEGREEGSLKEKMAIASNLRSMGMSISDISKATGLQEEEIKAL